MNKIFFDELNKFKNDYPNANIGDLQHFLDLHNKLICQSDENKFPLSEYFNHLRMYFNQEPVKVEKTNPFEELISKGLMTQTQFDVLNKVINESPFDLIISGSLALLLKGEINRPIGDFDLGVNSNIFNIEFKTKFDFHYGLYYEQALGDYDTNGKLNVTGYQYIIDGVKIDIFPTTEEYEMVNGFRIMKSTDRIWEFKKEIVESLETMEELAVNQHLALKKHKADIHWHEDF